jgi:putative methyltransferase (TIGR04325 family)
MCAALRGRLAGVTIAEEIPAQITGPTVVNASSSLQYIDDWRMTLKCLAALKPQHFIVSDTPFTDGRTYARRQTNLPRKCLACWVFNRAEFFSTMAQLGYRDVFLVEHELPITHKGAPGPSAFGSIVFRP